MTFRDIFKNSFLEGYAQGVLTPASVGACLMVACVMGIYIFAAYRIMCRKAFYNKSFSISLIAIAIVTAAIILTVQSNVVISLGMVGALSIVRFRTAIKDPMDLAFLFWAISVGIICGAGLAAIAVGVSLLLSVVIWLFNAMPNPKAMTLLLVSTEDLKAEGALMEVVKKHTKRAVVKSRTLSPEQMDLIIEVQSSDEAALVTAVMEQARVLSVSLVAHDGDTTF